jgi:hypothetical protein
MVKEVNEKNSAEEILKSFKHDIEVGLSSTPKYIPFEVLLR